MSRPARAAGGPAAAGRGGVQVRAASAGDLDIVVALRLALLGEHADNAVYGRLRADAPARARRLFAAQLASPNEATFLATRGGDPAPAGILRCVESAGSPLLHPDRYGYLSSAYVRPEHRRCGVLSALLESAERWCRARGLAEMRLHNVSDYPLAGTVWQALGFDVVEQLRLRRIED